MFKEAARIKKEMDDLRATTNVLGFNSDSVHVDFPVKTFVKKAIDEKLRFKVITRDSDDYPFELALFYDDVKFFNLCTFKDYEKHKELIKKATE